MLCGRKIHLKEGHHQCRPDAWCIFRPRVLLVHEVYGLGQFCTEAFVDQAGSAPVLPQLMLQNNPTTGCKLQVLLLRLRDNATAIHIVKEHLFILSPMCSDGVSRYFRF